jgi:hypothetical protein
MWIFLGIYIDLALSKRELSVKQHWEIKLREEKGTFII